MQPIPSNSWGDLDGRLSHTAKKATVQGGLVLTPKQWREIGFRRRFYLSSARFARSTPIPSGWILFEDSQVPSSNVLTVLHMLLTNFWLKEEPGKRRCDPRPLQQSRSFPTPTNRCHPATPRQRADTWTGTLSNVMHISRACLEFAGRGLETLCQFVDSNRWMVRSGLVEAGGGEVDQSIIFGRGYSGTRTYNELWRPRGYFQ